MKYNAIGVAGLVLCVGVVAVGQPTGGGLPSPSSPPPGAPSPSVPSPSTPAPGTPSPSGPATGTPSPAAPGGGTKGDGRAGEVDLRPRFKSGQQIRYRLKMTSKNEVTSAQMPDLEQSQEMTQEIGLLMRVREAADSGTTVELVYETVRCELIADGIKAKYDSTKPKRSTKPGQTGPGGMPAIADMDDDELLANAMQGIAGSVVTMTIDSKGNVTNVSSPAGLSGGGNIGAIPGLPGGIPGAGGGAAPGGGGGPLDWLVSSPGHSGFARVGESWTNRDRLGNTPLGSFQMTTVHTLRSANASQAVVDISGRIEPGSAAAGGQGKTQVKESGYKGRYVWDTALGQLKEMTTDSQVSIDGSALGTEMSMLSNSKVRLERVR
ncbi:MAG: hypothetical protein KF745_00395 [Phycisphaeraceae bacterium]|nr:hypothetical protein [Phycisphaeraceae bacterium]